MQTVSNAFLTAQRSSVSQTPFKFMFGDQPITEGILEAEIHMELASGNQFAVGCFNSSSCTITYFTGTTPMDAIVGQTVIPYFGYVIDEYGETEFVQKGVYTIPDTGVTQTDGYTTITAYDRSYYLPDDYVSQIDYTNEVYVSDVLSELSSLIPSNKLSDSLTQTGTTSQTITLDYTPITGTEIVLAIEYNTTIYNYTCVAGTSNTISATYGTITYDGDDTFTAVASSAGVSYVVHPIQYTCGAVFTLNNNSVDTTTIRVYTPPTGSYRDVIAYLAGLCGCNAIYVDDTEIAFRWPTSQNLSFTASDYCSGGFTLESDSDTAITRVICNDFIVPGETDGQYLDSSDDYIVTSDSDNFVFSLLPSENGIYIQTSASDITTFQEATALATRIGVTLDETTTIKYRGFSLTTLSGFPQVEVGDILSMTDVYDITTSLMVLTMTINWQGGLSTTFEAQVPLENKTEAVPRDSLSQAARVANKTAQYFWHEVSGDDPGAHITEIPKAEFKANPDGGGYNLLAKSDGVTVRNGMQNLANFSQNGIVADREDVDNTARFGFYYKSAYLACASSYDFSYATDSDYYCITVDEMIVSVASLITDSSADTDFEIKTYPNDGYSEIVLLNYPTTGSPPSTAEVRYAINEIVPFSALGDGFKTGSQAGVGENSVAFGSNLKNTNPNCTVVGKSNNKGRDLSDTEYRFVVGCGGDLTISDSERTITLNCGYDLLSQQWHFDFTPDVMATLNSVFVIKFVLHSENGAFYDLAKIIMDNGCKITSIVDEDEDGRYDLYELIDSIYTSTALSYKRLTIIFNKTNFDDWVDDGSTYVNMLIELQIPDDSNNYFDTATSYGRKYDVLSPFTIWRNGNFYIPLSGYSRTIAFYQTTDNTTYADGFTVDEDGNTNVYGNLTVAGNLGLATQTSGNWTYITIGNLFMGWYATTGSLTIGTAVGSVYSTSSSGSIALPTTLTSVLYANVDVMSSSYAVWTSMWSATTSTLYYRAMSALSRSSATYNINAYVVGTIS